MSENIEIIRKDIPVREDYLSISHELVHEDYVPESIDNLHNLLCSAQTLTIKNGDISIINELIQHNSGTKVLTIKGDTIIFNTSMFTIDKNMIDYDYTKFEMGATSKYLGSIDRYFIQHDYYSYIANNPGSDIKIVVFNAENSKNMPNILKNKLKPIPDLPDYQFDKYESVKYSKVKEKKYYILTPTDPNDKSHNEPLYALLIDLPYKIYSILKHWDNSYYYDIDDNQIKFNLFKDNNYVNTTIRNLATNGFTNPITFTSPDKVIYPRIGARGQIYASHFKLPSVPALLTIGAEAIGLAKFLGFSPNSDIKDILAPMLNEVCAPYLQF